MSRWCRRAVAAAAMALGVLAASGGAGAGTTPPPPPTDGAATTALADNEFIPDDVDLSECISAVPRPECGSEARGGWRQGLVLAAVVGGMTFIGWRIIRSARRNRPDPADSDVQNDEVVR